GDGTASHASADHNDIDNSVHTNYSAHRRLGSDSDADGNDPSGRTSRRTTGVCSAKLARETGISGGRGLGGPISSIVLPVRATINLAIAGQHMVPWHGPIPSRVITFSVRRSAPPDSIPISTSARVNSSQRQTTVSAVASVVRPGRGRYKRSKAARKRRSLANRRPSGR